MREVWLLAIIASTLGQFAPQQTPPEMMGMGPESQIPFPQISPQNLALNTQATVGFPSAAAPAIGANGLPEVSLEAALNEAISDGQADREREAFLAAQQAAQAKPRDLEAVETGKGKGAKKDKFGPHQAVPKLKKWLAAMDPMSYVSPTFSNPVAKHFFDQISDPKLAPEQRERLQRLVSSPYMFNMLGNPAYADPQLWSGLVSGAAVPYPMRNQIMSQRTMLPYRVASTGDAMSTNDHIAMNEYKKEAERSGVAGTVPNIAAHVKARKRLNHIFGLLNANHRAERSRTQATPHSDMLHDFFADPEEILRPKKGHDRQAADEEEES